MPKTTGREPRTPGVRNATSGSIVSPLERVDDQGIDLVVSGHRRQHLADVSLGRPVSTGFVSKVNGGSNPWRPFTVLSENGGTRTAAAQHVGDEQTRPGGP